jgi:hypothetical protein
MVVTPFLEFRRQKEPFATLNLSLSKHKLFYPESLARRKVGFGIRKLAVFSPSLSEEKAVVSSLLHGFSPVRPAGVGGLLALAFALACSSAAAAERLIWIGASAGTPRIDGIYAARFDDAAGTISPPTRVAAVLNPWSLEVHPALPVLYAAAAVSEGGRIESYMIDPGTGGLKPLGSLPGVASTLAVDPAGKRLFAASAIGSTVSCHAIADDGVPQPPGKSGQNLCRYGVEETDKERRKQPGYFRSRQLKPGMTAIAVGRAWRTATPEQQKRLLEEFKTLLVRTYSGALTQVKDQTVQLKPMRAAADDPEVVVRTEVKGKGEPIKLDYRLDKSGDTEWKIIDVNVGGLWLVQNYRTQFAQELAKGGVDGLIATLAERNKAAGKS